MGATFVVALFAVKPPFGGFQHGVANKGRYCLLTRRCRALNQFPRLVVHAEDALRTLAGSGSARPTFRRFFSHASSLGIHKKIVKIPDNCIDTIVIGWYSLCIDTNQPPITRESTMEAREERGLVIAAKSRGIKQKGKLWVVPV